MLAQLPDLTVKLMFVHGWGKKQLPKVKNVQDIVEDCLGELLGSLAVPWRARVFAYSLQIVSQFCAKRAFKPPHS